MSARGAGRVAREVLLTSGALLGVLCILLTGAAAVADVKPLVFRSGSMSPAIDTGDLAMSRTVQAADLQRGDVVSVVTASGSRVTHRVVDITTVGDERQLTLKGDANEKADGEAYEVASAEKVLFSIPKAGYVVNAMASPGGLFVLGLYVAAMVSLIIRRGPPSSGGAPGEDRRAGRRSSREPARVGRGMRRASAVGLATGILALASPASAAWTGSVPIVDTTFSAVTVTSQAQPQCDETGGVLGIGTTARLRWVQVNTQFVYAWSLRRSGGVEISSGTVGSGIAAGGTVTLNFAPASLSAGNQTYSVVIRARASTSMTWTAPTSTTSSVRRTGLLTATASCA